MPDIFRGDSSRLCEVVHSTSMSPFCATSAVYPISIVSPSRALETRSRPSSPVHRQHRQSDALRDEASRSCPALCVGVQSSNLTKAVGNCRRTGCASACVGGVRTHSQSAARHGVCVTHRLRTLSSDGSESPLITRCSDASLLLRPDGDVIMSQNNVASAALGLVMLLGTLDI